MIALLLGAALLLAPFQPLISATGASASIYGDYQRLHTRSISRKEFNSMRRDIARLKREVAQLKRMIKRHR